MKVLVLNGMLPFVWGGAEQLSWHLVRNLRLQGHDAEQMRIPFAWDPPEALLDEIVVARSLRLCNVDRVIALKFPVYHVPWHDKVVWLMHQHRQAYDLFDAGQSNVPRTPRGDEIRRAIRMADDATFAAARKIYCNSEVTADRLLQYNGVPSEILMPPLNDPEIFTGGPFGDYILAPGRVGPGKRQHLLVEAMAHLPASARLVVAGPPDDDAYAEELRRLVEANGLANRVTLRLEFVPRHEIAALVNGARAIAYLPFDEDSVGYVTMEAFEAAKPVVTSTDSGGLLKIVLDGRTGYVAESIPEDLASALAPLWNSASHAKRLGDEARAVWRSHDAGWPATVEKLVS